MFYNFLFPKSFKGTGVSLVILILRAVFGVLFLLHGKPGNDQVCSGSLFLRRIPARMR
jgi:uncharacterized membrane protein YphA (DoxX/SURF4 family)